MRRTAVLLVLLPALAGLGLTPPANATSGPEALQSLAVVQTKQLFREYDGQPQAASPATCADSSRVGGKGPLVLPTLSFGSGEASFTCTTGARRALVDLGGFIVAEDARGDTYTLEDGTELTFSRRNLARICDDAVRYLPGPAPATLDGAPVTGTQVTTGVFRVQVNPGADDSPGSPYYQDSVDLGHPGALSACYVGFKARVPITETAATLVVDLTAFAPAETTFTYSLQMRPRV